MTLKNAQNGMFYFVLRPHNCAVTKEKKQYLIPFLE